MDLNVSYSLNTYHSFSSSLISEETRRKLISLGIDPSTVTSESQAKIIIEKAEGTHQAATTKKTSSLISDKNIYLSEGELIKKAKELANKMGIQISKDLKLDDILTLIAQNIQKALNSNPEVSVKSKYIEYNNELNSIKTGYSTITQNEKAIIMSMVYNANINKMILGL